MTATTYTEEVRADLNTRNRARQIARPKPKYHLGDRGECDEAGLNGEHQIEIPEDQFWNPPKEKK